MFFKKKVRSIVRFILGAGKEETIRNAIDRHIIKFESLLYKKRYSKSDLKKALIKTGLTKGTSVFVHSSWRQFYNFDGTPEDVIEIIESIIGEEGTLLMPSYGSTSMEFDVDLTSSKAGVISEVFRTQKGTKRSYCTHFSVAARGKHADNMLKQHINSVYGFDTNSPLYLLSQQKQGKVLFLGLSSKPTSISLFHCAGYILKDRIDFFRKNIFTEHYKAKLIVDNKIFSKNMLSRNYKYQNNDKVFKQIFDSIKNKEIIKISNLDIVIINANEGLSNAIKFAEEGKFCYKKNIFV